MHATSPNLVCLLLHASAILAAPSAIASGLTVEMTTNGVQSSASPSGTGIAAGGTYYNGNLLTPSAGLTFDVIASGSASPFLSGTLIVSNHTAASLAIDIDLTHGIDAPLPSAIQRKSLVGHVPFGGAVASQPGALMHEILLDGAASPGLLPPGYSSSGSIGPLTDLNQAAITGAGAATSFGHRWQFELPAGGTVVLNAVLRLDISFDLDGNGVVNGGDLGVLLANWGQAGTGDFNLDGVVDAADLGLLLAKWG